MPQIGSGGSFDPKITQDKGPQSQMPQPSTRVEGPSAQDVDLFNQSMGKLSDFPKGVLPAMDHMRQIDPGTSDKSNIAKAGIEKIESSQKNFQGLLNNINHGLSNPELGTREIMQVQFNLAQLNLQQSLMGKIASKATQAIQKLFSNQG